MPSFSTEFQGFKDQIRALGVNLTFLYPKTLKYPSWASSAVGKAQRQKEWEEKTKDLPLAVGIEWLTGGRTGGNCYQDTPEYSSLDPEQEPEFGDLDKILEWACPNLTFLAYKRLMREVLKTGTRYEDEYYGNHSIYGQKWVVLEDLHKWLLKEQLP